MLWIIKQEFFLNPITTADWANANGFGRSNGIGNRIGKGQFYDKASQNYGFSYVKPVNNVSEMLDYVKHGYTVCACVPGHWIAVVDYNSSLDMYLLL